MKITKIRTNKELEFGEVRVERENCSSFSITEYKLAHMYEEPVAVIEFERLFNGPGTIWERFLRILEDVCNRNLFEEVNIEERLYDFLKNAKDEDLVSFIYGD